MQCDNQGTAPSSACRGQGGFLSALLLSRSYQIVCLLRAGLFSLAYGTVRSTRFAAMKLAEWMSKLLCGVIGCGVVHQKALCLLSELCPFQGLKSRGDIAQ